MRTLFCAAALLPIALLGAGCKSGPSLVGKWTGTMKGQTGTFDFTTDNKMSFGIKQGPADVTITGDYKVEGDTVTITMKDIDLKGLPPATADMVKKMAKQQMSGVLNKPEKNKIAFTSDDQVTLSGSKGEAITLSRVKEGA